MNPQRLLLAILPLALCSPGTYGQKVDPVNWSLQVTRTSNADLDAQLKAEVAPGWHLYAMDQPESGPRPLRIALPSAHGYVLKVVRAPPAQVAHDANFDAPTQHYEGSVVFELLLATPSASLPNELLAEVRYQACNREMCLPPTTVRVAASVPR